ncbi:hypothetical protein [Pseudomonas sp. NBRC 111134]|uniref:hypothetical protein n=1 Tax=Pseudomonas sp. NBRC 111134 TaxID=1661049 RepID=UPI0012E25B11|nr:hypothetical protein [Pseudomonas sp. NBRC 111134]
MLHRAAFDLYQDRQPIAVFCTLGLCASVKTFHRPPLWGVSLLGGGKSTKNEHLASPEGLPKPSSQASLFDLPEITKPAQYERKQRMN